MGPVVSGVSKFLVVLLKFSYPTPGLSMTSHANITANLLNNSNTGSAWMLAHHFPARVHNK